MMTADAVCPICGFHFIYKVKIDVDPGTATAHEISAEMDRTERVIAAQMAQDLMDHRTECGEGVCG